ncbi:conserved hypothetical protein [Leishmania infantum JPCM5]|uniref:UTP23 sensor motif region domain-containing protein n=2 Tax=Leishmania infantum TaxID=5671 RepID=E9AGD2_LEIIN|nr:conserved hypothetical protein [Leishmania infantum JPCM5]CAC9462979.1 hypothetical_protein_-_conserved [Leishmania infantum]CBZ08432.1 conserved hypothetical protein [Leishmania infantum JPCM5]SUZ39968.1 hypothetical_protein_-_conserved [Leishmania infantum]|eukprot:XP_003392284.1 conserved hypothetical protein [Leishmania infantum JPCM5]
MKRRVLRAHANKRCLRILSASHLIQTSSSSFLSSAASGDRGYAVLCDASFLRAVLLSYWQANAPAIWREARRRKLRKAAAVTSASESTRAGVSSEIPAPLAADKIAAATAASIARLPFGDLPALSPHAFLVALLCDAFQGERGIRSVSDNSAAAVAAATPPVDFTSASKFHCYCLPETVAALHRMRYHGPTSAVSATALANPCPPNSSVVDASLTRAQKKSGANSKRQRPPTPLPSTTSPRSEQHHRMTETEAWLSASFGNLATMRDSNGDGVGARRHAGPSPSSAAFPLTFQEVPAAVVNHLLSRITLIQSEEQRHRDAVAVESPEVSRSPEMADGAPLPTRNECRAIGEFMLANDSLLGRCPREGVDASACDPSALRLASMPLFRDHRVATYSPQGAAAKRRRRRRRNRTAAGGGDDVGELPSLATANAALAGPQEARGNGASATPSTTSRPYSPRTFFVATQSHDVRRRLAAVTPLLRLTTNPDALWIEQRGTAYQYGEEGAEARRPHIGMKGPGNCSSLSVAAAASSRGGRGSSEPGPSRSARFSHTLSSPHAATATTTVIAAAPQLSRADVAFMKHLGTAAEVPLPAKPSHHPHPQEQQQLQPRASPASGNGVSDRAPADRKRRRQKGQNPLSMKKKQRREVFRAH